ncbi:hypothetical protein [Streptomyces misionensis]|uniref:hypothetical protein n=1 Tax=Streptomyces misionensis TaxID=67331 RepID=UPI0034022BD9
MPYPKPGHAIDITELVKKLDSVRSAIAFSAGVDYRERHHPDRREIDTPFDDLIDWVRAHQSQDELAGLIKSASDPDLEPGDTILVNGSPTTVREIRLHKPRSHEGSGLPQHLAAMEIITGRHSRWLSLTPQV